MKSGCHLGICQATESLWCWSIDLGSFLNVVKEFSARGVLGGLHGEKSVISFTYEGCWPTRFFSRGSVVITTLSLKRFISYAYVHPKLLFYSALGHQKILWLAPGGLKGRDYLTPLHLFYLYGKGVLKPLQKPVRHGSLTHCKCYTSYSNSIWWL